jgi:hypothetical protein
MLEIAGGECRGELRLVDALVPSRATRRPPRANGVPEWWVRQPSRDERSILIDVVAAIATTEWGSERTRRN